MKKFFSMMAMIAVVFGVMIIAQSCVEDDFKGPYLFQFGISKGSISLESIDELETMSNAFKSALNVSSSSFSVEAKSYNAARKEVEAGSKKAFQNLKDQGFKPKGQFTYCVIGSKWQNNKFVDDIIFEMTNNDF